MFNPDPKGNHALGIGANFGGAVLWSGSLFVLVYQIAYQM